MKTYKLLGADGKTYESTTKGEYGGTSQRRIYGKLTCRAALAALQKVGPYAAERVFFADEAAAKAAGYRPCGTCMPDEYKDWKAASG